jgi:hypothetical protein
MLAATPFIILADYEPMYHSKNYNFAFNKMLIVNQWNNCQIDKCKITGGKPVPHHTGIW